MTLKMFYAVSSKVHVIEQSRVSISCCMQSLLHGTSRTSFHLMPKLPYVVDNSFTEGKLRFVEPGVCVPVKLLDFVSCHMSSGVYWVMMCDRLGSWCPTEGAQHISPFFPKYFLFSITKVRNITD